MKTIKRNGDVTMYKIIFECLDGLKGSYENIDNVVINYYGNFINFYYNDHDGTKRVYTIDYLKYFKVSVIDEEEKYIVFDYTYKTAIKKIQIDYLYKDGKEYLKTFNTKENALRFLYKMKSDIKYVNWKCDDPDDNNYLWKKFKP